MARISTYAIDGVIVDGDKVIGSDANNSMVTKNYTIGDMVAYFAQSIGADYLVPYVNATQDVNLGSFNLAANSLSLTGNITLNGNPGLVGQVLMSNGAGDASWSYNIGSQTLQNVLTQGNTANKSILLSNANGAATLDIDNINGTTGVYLVDNSTNNESALTTSYVSVENSTLKKSATYFSNKIRYEFDGDYVDLIPTGYINNTLYLPSGSGALALSVNGVYADMGGTITIPIGLGSVTQVDTSGPITGGPITTTGTIGITKANATTDGYLSNNDWITFNNKVPTSRTLTINGTTYDLSANRTWNVQGLPDQATHNGQFLTTDGSVASWADVDALPNQSTHNGQFLTTDGTTASWTSLPPSGVSDVTATSPITSSGGSTPDISTSMSTNKLIGRSTAGTGVMEEITVGSGLSLSGGTLAATSTSPLTTKGDLYTYSTVDARLPVGLDTQVLLADSSTATGLKWGTNTAATPLGYYGAWQTDTTQTAASSNVGYPMIFSIADVTPNGISIVSDGTNLTRITFANTGIYNIQFSSQFQNLANSPQDVTIWLRKNGTDVTGSAGVIGLEARKNPGDPYHIIAGWNYVLSVVAGEYYQLVWSTTDHTNVQMQFYAAGSPPPSASSVILTVTQQAGIMAGTGITALNSLTGSVQTMATNGSGTDFNISSAGSTHTFNLPTASVTNRGALSSADWTTFNNKANSYYSQFMTNQFSYFLPMDGTTLYDTLRCGGTLTAAGTVSPLSENPMGVQYQTATAVGSATSLYGNSMGGTLLGVNFQFEMIRKFRIGTTNGAQRFFTGISSLYSATTPTNVEPTSQINSIGVCKLQATSTLYLMWNDGTGTASSLNTGFTAVSTAYTYVLRIYKTFGVASITIELTQIENSTGNTSVFSTTIVSDYNTGANYYPVAWMGNNTAVTGAVSFKDYGCMMTKRNAISS